MTVGDRDKFGQFWEGVLSGTKVVAGVMGDPMSCFSPNRPREVNGVNDNYHGLDPIDSQFCSVQGLELVNQTVNCNAFSHAHFVTDTGLSQKRGLSPDWKSMSNLQEGYNLPFKMGPPDKVNLSGQCKPSSAKTIV